MHRLLHLDCVDKTSRMRCPWCAPTPTHHSTTPRSRPALAEWSFKLDLCVLWLKARGKKRQKGWFPASHVKVLGSNSGKSTPASQPGNTHTYTQTPLMRWEQWSCVLCWTWNMPSSSVSLSGDSPVWLHSCQQWRDELHHRSSHRRFRQDRSWLVERRAQWGHWSLSNKLCEDDHSRFWPQSAV